jgi:ABC-type Fe3+/spermidine/putrescine transport system ATPase subunit
MRNGKIQQVGTPGEIYDTPNTEWVSSFIGKANYFEARRNIKGIFKFNGVTVKCDNPIIAKSTIKESLFIIRPEDMEIVKPHTGFINAKIKSVIYKGLKYDIACSWEGHELQIESTANYPIGKYIGVKWSTNDVHFIQRSREE